MSEESEALLARIRELNDWRQSALRACEVRVREINREYDAEITKARRRLNEITPKETEEPKPKAEPKPKPKRKKSPPPGVITDPDEMAEYLRKRGIDVG